MLSKRVAMFAVVCLAGLGVSGLQSAIAQETHPPKVLVIQVENLKPGKAGSPHQKTEAAVAKLAADAKWPQHYFGMTSLSGPPRALFFFPYDSFAEVGKEMARESDQSEASQKIEQANMEDAELVEAFQTSAYTFRPDLSYKPNAPLKSLHFFEITRIKVKLGHTQEWEEYLKMLQSHLDKSAPDRHLAVYQSAYGWENGGIWLILIPMGSMAEADELFASRDGMRKSMGEDSFKHFRDLAEASIVNSQRNVFAVNPEMSYVWDDWAKGDSFWQKKSQ